MRREPKNRIVSRISITIAVLSALAWGFSCARVDGAASGPSWPSTWDAETWILVGWLAVKYLWPKSRAAVNFWGGLADLMRGDKGKAIRKIISSSGIAHTTKPRKESETGGTELPPGGLTKAS